MKSGLKCKFSYVSVNVFVHSLTNLLIPIISQCLNYLLIIGIEVLFEWIEAKMPSKVFEEYKSYTFCRSPTEEFFGLQPLEEKEILRTFEVIPYKPPPVYRSSVTLFMSEERKEPKTLIIPIQWNASEWASPPKKTKRSAYKCVTFSLDEANCF